MTVTIIFSGKIKLDGPVPRTLEDAVQAVQDEIGSAGVIVLDAEEVIPDKAREDSER